MPPTPSTYERLREYVARRMRMSHIDQPLMLMELLGRRSPAPAQDVARRNRRAWWARFSPATASPATSEAPTTWWAARS
jgi:hypothetical protein